MSPALLLRAATAADVAAMVQLEAVSFATDRLAARNFRRFLRCGNCSLLVAEDAGRFAGYILVLYRANSTAGRIYSVAVSPACRGRGVGEALLAAAEEAARTRGRSTMRLEVRPDNAAAIRLYEKHGYRRFGTFAGFYEDGTDALRLEKVLA